MSRHVPVEALIDGVVHTLTALVLPAVSSRFARGQLYAAVDVLRNLRDRVEPKAALLEMEAASADRALVEAVRLLGAGGAPEAARRIADAAAAAPEPLPERLAALRAALALAYETIAALPDEVAAQMRRPLDEHLATQTMRDLAVLKPSLLGEISRG
jgi:hypothetical protein